MSYDKFLESKKLFDRPSGFKPGRLPNKLFDFQKAIVSWALQRGRAAIFADTGLGKTFMQVAWADAIYKEEKKPILILAPLCVAYQTVKEAKILGVGIEYVRSHPNKNGIFITNYDMMGKFKLESFRGIVLDESSIIKHDSSATRKALISACQKIPYRLSCTATPSPNDHMELGNQAEFLGVMNLTEMLAMFFTHDGGETSKWRLKGHGKTRFWEWLGQWSCVIRKPSDLGFSDDGYNLPPLKFHEHVVESGIKLDEHLFTMQAQTLSERISARRETTEARVLKCAEIVNKSKEPFIVWCHLNNESVALKHAIKDAVEVSGTDSSEQKEERINGFSDGKYRVMITKPSIAGFGLNWQHCHNMAFVGLSDSYEQLYQAIRRCYRFGQKHSVNVHMITSDIEGAVTQNIKRKEKQAEEMAMSMVKHVSNICGRNIMKTKTEKANYETETAEGRGWRLHLGDCVEVANAMKDESIDYSIFSPPFSSLYTYSNSDRDMGNSKNDGLFLEHFGFLVKELFRILRQGRLVSVHCTNFPAFLGKDGFIGLKDFRGDIIRLFQSHGFVYHSEICIWKDPVVAMQRTKALGLLWKQLKKDAAMSRQGIPDYIVTFRKDGENTKPISNTPEEFPVDLWQNYASPVWMDINQSNTLQFHSARENDDERHICPLQLDVIRRCLTLWSANDDLVFSPFAGIGSEGHVAIKMDRRFVGSELKRSYWNLAASNLKAAEENNMSLFSTESAR